MPIEFRLAGLLEERPPAHEIRLAHWEGLVRGGRLAVGDPSTLGLKVHRHIYEATGLAHRLHQPADRGSLVARPAPEIQDHVGSKLQRFQSKPEQPAFQHISLPVRLRLAEQRNHPLIRCQPQRSVLLGQLPGSRGLSGPWQADRQEQRGHTHIVQGFQMGGQLLSLPRSLGPRCGPSNAVTSSGGTALVQTPRCWSTGGEARVLTLGPLSLACLQRGQREVQCRPGGAWNVRTARQRSPTDPEAHQGRHR